MFAAITLIFSKRSFYREVVQKLQLYGKQYFASTLDQDEPSHLDLQCLSTRFAHIAYLNSHMKVHAGEYWSCILFIMLVNPLLKDSSKL